MWDERASSSNPLGRLADAVLGDHKGKHAMHQRPGPQPGGRAFLLHVLYLSSTL